MYFKTNNTERLRIKSDGEILMGTTTDRGVAGQRFNSGSGWGGTLQIEKPNPSNGNNNVPFVAITAWNGANEQYTGGISFNRSNNNTQGTHGAVNTNQQLGNIAFNGSDGTNFIQGAEIFAIPEQTFATNDGPTALCFGTVPDGTGETRPQERLRIDSSGNVGINDSSPTFKLDVNGTGRFTDNLTINTTKKILTNSSTGQLTIQAGATYPGGSIKFAGGQSGATDRGTTIFYNSEDTNLTETVRITSAGHLNIGGASPSSSALCVKMATNKHIGFSPGQSEVGSVPALVAFQDNGSLAEMGFRGTDLRFATGSAERLRINNLGVLQIKQTTNTNQGIEWYSASNNKSASIGWGNGNANFEFKNFRQDSQSTGPYGNIDFFTGSTSSPPLVMRMQVTGEVGIGTDNPTTKLHVQGGQNNKSIAIDNHMSITSSTDGSTLVGNSGVTYVSGTGGQADGNWRDIFTNFRYRAGSFVAAIGDTTVKTMISGHFYVTAPNYGVVVWNEITNNNSWNSGVADMQIVTHNTSNYKLQIKHTSYYNTNNNFGYYIMFNQVI